MSILPRKENSVRDLELRPTDHEHCQTVHGQLGSVEIRGTLYRFEAGKKGAKVEWNDLRVHFLHGGIHFGTFRIIGGLFFPLLFDVNDTRVLASIEADLIKSGRAWENEQREKNREEQAVIDERTALLDTLSMMDWDNEPDRII